MFTTTVMVGSVRPPLPIGGCDGVSRDAFADKTALGIAVVEVTDDDVGAVDDGGGLEAPNAPAPMGPPRMDEGRKVEVVVLVAVLVAVLLATASSPALLSAPVAMLFLLGGVVRCE